LIVKTFRSIFLKEQEENVIKMRESEEGCTEKCRLKNKLMTIEVSRNEKIVKELI